MPLIQERNKCKTKKVSTPSASGTLRRFEYPTVRARTQTTATRLEIGSAATFATVWISA